MLSIPEVMRVREDGSVHFTAAAPTRLERDEVPLTLMQARFVRVLYTIARRRQASVTSFIRTARHNKIVGGLRRSYHLDGLAADLVPDEPSDASAIVTDAHTYGLDAVNEHTHVHIELDVRRINRSKGTNK